MTKNIGSMAKIILFNKPFGVLCQFTDPDGSKTLADFIKIKEVYAAGRLDKDSEGLLLLTDNGVLQNKITDPKHKEAKTYWVQVEGQPNADSLLALQNGVALKDGKTRPAQATLIDEPAGIWPRDPPVRERQSIPTSWLQLSITEGKNRQVRRMTAAVGHPTLRLVRAQIGDWKLDGLQPGEYKQIEVESPKASPTNSFSKKKSYRKKRRET